jgi:hypothetical protein
LGGLGGFVEIERGFPVAASRHTPFG